MIPGAMVETSHEIYTLPREGEESYDDPVMPAGTVGIIIQLPDTDRPRQYLVNFVGGLTYWMYTNEIQPYINYDKKV